MDYVINGIAVEVEKTEDNKTAMRLDIYDEKLNETKKEEEN